MKNNKGFTFVELIVVVVIIAIVAGTATYGFNSYFSSARIRATESIINVIDYARAIAQTSNYKASIDIYYTDKYCYARVYTTDLDGNKIDKDYFEICKSQYTIYYTPDGSSDYVSLKDGLITLTLGKSGFMSSNYVSSFITDYDKDSEIFLVKEIGRAYKNN